LATKTYSHFRMYIQITLGEASADHSQID
jgi:hypothetical protein